MTLPEFPAERDRVEAALDVRLPRPGRLALSCPRCNLVIYPRTPTLAPQHCPRCMARRRVAVILRQE